MARFSAFLNVLILLGALQGFIISSLLLFSKGRRLANRLLGWLVLLISLACLNLYGSNNNWANSNLLRFVADIVPLVIVMPFGPLIYFYVKAVIDPSFKITRKQKRNFYTVIIDFVPSIAVIGFIIGLVCGLVKNNPLPVGSFIDNYNVYADVPRWASITVYLWLSARHLKGAQGVQPATVKWLKELIQVFFAFQVLWFIFLVPYEIPQYSNKLLDAVDWFPLYIPMAAIIYWLGIRGYMAVQNETPVKKIIAPAPAISGATIQQAVAALKKAMEKDGLYLNPTLSLEVVAQHTGLPPKTISAVLNQHMHKSFNEFVNEYRVKAFIEKMQQPANDNLTIAGIAFDCGFNSQATFQRTFKQVTGMPPTEYRKTALAVH